MSDLKTLTQARIAIQNTVDNVKQYAVEIITKLDQGHVETADVDVEQIETRIEVLDKAWFEFRECNSAIKLIDPKDLDTNYAMIFENKFYESKSLLKRILKKQSNSHTEQGNTSNVAMHNRSTFDYSHERTMYQASEIRLPRVVIENFFGDYAKWPSFQDQFITSIHKNEQLSDIHKFQYLKSLLKGEAATVIRHFSLTEANYTTAWNKLVKRYDKKKYSVKAFIDLFMNQSSMQSNSNKQLRIICDNADECIRGLAALDTEERDPWLIQILLKKLDMDTQQAWAEETVNTDKPTIDELIEFLTDRCDAFDSCISSSTNRNNYVKSTKQSVQLHATQSINTNNKCALCNSDHPLYKCFEYRKMKIDSRKQFLESSKLCHNCLSSNHITDNCQSKSRCFRCNQKHHTTIHVFDQKQEANISTSRKCGTQSYATSCSTSAIDSDSSPSKTNDVATTINIPSTSNNKNNNTKNSQNIITHSSLSISAPHSFDPSKILLSTILCYIIDDRGEQHVCRALLDSGSQSTLIAENCVQRIGLHRRHSAITVSGICYTKVESSKGETNITVISRHNKEYRLTINAVILNKLTPQLPSQQFDDHQWPVIQTLELADPAYNTPAAIDIILGNDIFLEVLLQQKIKLDDHLFAQLTHFGWIIGGCLESAKQPSFSFHHITTTNNGTDLQMLQRFWALEEVPSAKVKRSTEEQYCEDHYVQNTTRSADGRYIVRLPFKSNAYQLGSTYDIAVKRLISLDRKLSKDVDVKTQYCSFMCEYQQLGHMEPVNTMDTKGCYHLPHHCVMKQSSSTTKLRVVFDGSCMSSTGISLNDVLHVGPTIQPDLITIILRFREHKIAICGDIEKMYRQVVVHPDDRCYQRIIWHPNSEEQQIQQFQLTTVTYGLSCAPYLAIRTLHQLASDYSETHSDAAKCVTNEFYVDDMLTGCESIQDAVSLYHNMNSLLSKAGFKIRKWMSNEQSFLQVIPEVDREASFLDVTGDPTVKTLGVFWNPRKDCFVFKVALSNKEVLTKRNLLSEISRIFDPLGWLGPVVITMKLLFQSLWLRKVEWDEHLPHDVLKQWLRIRKNLQHLERIEIPRYLHTSQITHKNVQLHGFADASEKAYGAVAYLRIANTNGDVHIHLIAAKSKVTPIQQVTIARLELCAAVLLSQLMKYVQDNSRIPIDSKHAWSDSIIVLAWLADYPRKWKSFIGNRTSIILETLPRQMWAHVPGKQNPADLLSRGVDPENLVNNQLWFNGPEWLAMNSDQWPNQTNLPHKSDDSVLEIRKKYLIVQHVQVLPHFCSVLFEKISSLPKIYRVIGYIYRFINKTSSKLQNPERQPSRNTITINCHVNSIQPPTVEEISYAEKTCIKWVQGIYQPEIRAILETGELNHNSQLVSLSPIVDEDGILRLGGRIQNSTCSFDTKHPIILPKCHVYSRLLIAEYHTTNFHPGPTLLTSLLRQRFWIIGCRNLSRYYVSKCIICFKQKKFKNQQLMGNLPAERVSIGRPFLYVGVDYAGPLYIRNRKGPGKVHLTKAWIALFICMSVKAVHVELVTDMTTTAFIAALKRFISRRGYPVKIHCDNGSNFVGSKRELSELFILFKSEKHYNLINNFLSPRRIEYQFNPAQTPHFGGLWESNIKSIKQHLKKATGSTSLTYEEAETILIQIEGILNSRPLCAISEDVTDYNALTPAHFLIGEPITAIPEPDLSHLSQSHLSKWQNVQNRVKGFWKSWSQDYLCTLNQRAKWQHKYKNLKVGQLVLIQDDGIPQSCWLMGRIVQLHPGSDNVVRVVTIKSSRGELTRPIVKLVPLPIDDEEKTPSQLNSAQQQQ